MDARIRPARPDDVEDVVAFTRDTWSDRETGDYLPEVFPQWVEGDDPERHSLVADVDGRAVGTLQAVRLSPSEAWLQGLRVHPDHRGDGIGTRLVHEGFSWARDHGAEVARAMVFSWNEMGLGLARTAGFEPETEFRWAHPEPDATANTEMSDATADTEMSDATANPETAWAYWRESSARRHLAGLGLDTAEPWALSAVTRERLDHAAAGGGLLVVGDDETRGFAYRVRTTDREAGGETERWAEYGVAAWANADACEALLAAVARDAAAVDADRARALVPETVGAVSDVALAGHRLSESPDFVLAADLTESFEG